MNIARLLSNARLRALWVGIVMTMGASNAIAQDQRLNAERVLDSDGLPLSNVHTIMQDRQGFIWFGTTGGVQRYDGYSFRSYRYDASRTNGLSMYEVSRIAEDSSGFIWVGSVGMGLNRIDRRTGDIKRFNHDASNTQSIGDDHIYDMAVDSSGNLWVATAQGVDCISENSGIIRRYSSQDLGIVNYARSTSVFVDHAGTVWLVSNSGSMRSKEIHLHLSRFVQHSRAFRTYTLERTISSARILGEIPDGLIIGPTTYSGSLSGMLLLYDPKTNTTRAIERAGRREEALEQYPLAFINGCMWYAKAAGTSDRQGIHMVFGLDRDSIAQGANPKILNLSGEQHKSIVTGQINVVLKDRTGVLWVGTNEGGYRIRPSEQGIRTWRHNPNDLNTVSSRRIRSVLVDRKDRLWVGTDFGLNRLDNPNSIWKQYYSKSAQPGRIVNSTVNTIYEDDDGTLLFGTNGGISRFNERTNTFTDGVEGFQWLLAGPPRVWSMLRDSENRLWIGTNTEGLGCIDPLSKRTHWFVHNPADSTSILDGGVWNIHEDKQGTIWIATNDGLCRLLPNSKTFRRYVHNPKNSRSLPGSRVWKILEAHNSDLWITSFGHGIARYNKVSDDFTRFSDRNGIPTNNVHGLLEDYRGKFWLTSPQGLARWDPKTEAAQVFDVQDGLQGNEFTFGAHFAAANGTLYFGGTNGLSAINPKVISVNRRPPPMVVTAFHLFDSLARVELIDGDTVHLSHGQNFFSFEFAALDYTNPGKNKYAYYLEGVDANWIHCSSQHRYAGYTDLAPGTYVFHVKGSNSDGIWNDNGIAITVVIQPPWWGTWTFRGGAALVVMALAAMGMRFRNNEIRKHEREKRMSAVQATLESQESERHRIARDLHDGIGQLLAAAVINLTRARDIINKRVQPTKRDSSNSHASSPDESASITDEVIAPLERTAWILQRTSDDIRSLSHALGTSTLHEQGLALAVGELLSYVESQESTHFDFIVTDLDVRLPEHIEVGLFRVTQELITNILRHAHATDATIQLVKDESEVRLTIEDNGKGFDTTSPHTGMGLRNIAARVAAIGGELHFDSTVGHGTTVTVVVKT